MKSGVQIYYNDYVHAKLMLVDGLVAFISSMNFTSSSSGGKAWEAGIVTWQQGAVNSGLISISTTINDTESKRALPGENPIN
jgi:phosphatidylserine/phosphatidylglycerophosphate/cardiolipin synthase-like enzyme